MTNARKSPVEIRFVIGTSYYVRVSQHTVDLGLRIVRRTKRFAVVADHSNNKRIRRIGNDQGVEAVSPLGRFPIGLEPTMWADDAIDYIAATTIGQP